jgi:hypothetical protein
LTLLPVCCPCRVRKTAVCRASRQLVVPVSMICPAKVRRPAMAPQSQSKVLAQPENGSLRDGDNGAFLAFGEDLEEDQYPAAVRRIFHSGRGERLGR